MNKPAQTIRIVLADDHTLVRAGIRALLEKVPSVEVVGEADDGREVLELVRSTSPDLVLMDIAMPGLNGLEATARLVEEFPEVRVIILSMHRSEEYVLRALRVGASGYLLKRSATTELTSAIQRVMRGDLHLSVQLSARLLKALPVRAIADRKDPLDKLTARQREILQLIAEGENTKSIAHILKVSPKTVEYHRARLMKGLNLHDIPSLVRFALRSGLISDES
jgi:DNA-binding NarL/FixJ family response regulator